MKPSEWLQRAAGLRVPDPDYDMRYGPMHSRTYPGQNMGKSWPFAGSVSLLRYSQYAFPLYVSNPVVAQPMPTPAIDPRYANPYPTGGVVVPGSALPGSSRLKIQARTGCKNCGATLFPQINRSNPQYTNAPSDLYAQLGGDLGITNGYAAGNIPNNLTGIFDYGQNSSSGGGGFGNGGGITNIGSVTGGAANVSGNTISQAGGYYGYDSGFGSGYGTRSAGGGTGSIGGGYTGGGGNGGGSGSGSGGGGNGSGSGSGGTGGTGGNGSITGVGSWQRSNIVTLPGF